MGEIVAIEKKSQGTLEEIAYKFTFTGATTLSGPTVTVWEVDSSVTPNTKTDKTATVMPTNSPTIAANVVTLSNLKLLTRDKKYEIHCKLTVDGRIQEAVGEVWGKDVVLDL